jgi:predicted alpha/beta superfamily hydrolase
MTRRETSYRQRRTAVIENSQPAALSSALPTRLRCHEPFVSHHVEPRHGLIVYLPPTYDSEPTRRFPVLYMQDGQNLFDPETSFIKGNYWRLGEAADALTLNGTIEPLIIVGIENAGVRRIDEYTPVADQRLGGGHGDAYGRMLVEELKPMIDQQYRTLPEGRHCGLGGSSLGGLVSLYLGLKYSAVFSRLAVLSPSIWWGRRSILKTVTRLGQKPDLHIWLDMGTKETARAVPDARLLRDALLKKGWQAGQDLRYMEAEGGEHTESAWAARSGPMLQFLFPHRP